MTNDRPSLGFEDELENFDPRAWQSGRTRSARAAAPKDKVEAAAEVSGFRSREAAQGPRKQTPPRRHRTGRNTQFNIKADPVVITRFVAISDAQGWVFGETLEAAVDLLEQAFPASTKTQR